MNIRKGPNSLGGKSENTISVAYRGIHPSFIGRIDINVCGNSDPGTSGVLTPFCETKGLYFVDRTEPEEFKFKLLVMEIKFLLTRFLKSLNSMVISLLNSYTNQDYYVMTIM